MKHWARTCVHCYRLADGLHDPWCPFGDENVVPMRAYRQESSEEDPYRRARGGTAGAGEGGGGDDDGDVPATPKPPPLPSPYGAAVLLPPPPRALEHKPVASLPPVIEAEYRLLPAPKEKDRGPSIQSSSARD